MGSCWDTEMGLQSCVAWPVQGVTLEEMVGAAGWESQLAGTMATPHLWEPQESTQHTTFLFTSY